jgi:branched-chain amino acid transport system permease protein
MNDALTTEQRTPVTEWLWRNIAALAVVAFLVALPFILAVLDGQSISSLLSNESGASKFWQGVTIEIFILAVYAISYDLLLGITGIVSFGHAMFFAVGAYLTGIALKSLGWSIWATLVAVVVAGILQALLFAIVLPRVKGITFALVTLGIASVFSIVIQSRELGELTGADVGLQGVVPPEFLNPSAQRLRFYFIALAFTIIVYLIYRRFVDSPTGRVCVATRENEDRARMLGFNTFWFKLVALIVSSITAALAGTMHTLHQPIVSPNVAGLGFTIVAFLIILIGGIGTLSGALIGAAVYRLLEYFLHDRFGETASFLLGVIFVLLVLFVPYGIVGTWRLRRLQWRQGWQRLISTLTGNRETATGRD